MLFENSDFYFFFKSLYLVIKESGQILFSEARLLFVWVTRNAIKLTDDGLAVPLLLRSRHNDRFQLLFLLLVFLLQRRKFFGA